MEIMSVKKAAIGGICLNGGYKNFARKGKSGVHEFDLLDDSETCIQTK